MNSYKTICKDAVAEFVERKSRFISYIYKVNSEDECIKHLEALRKKHYDATHVVYAYKIRENNIQRFSDDGEPQGTAGVCVLDVINKTEITDVLIAAVRYFGGTLLGAGGLVRAYSKTGSIGVEAAGILTMCECVNFEIKAPYNLLGKIQYVLNENGAIKTDIEYKEDITLKYYIKEDEYKRLENKITDALSGMVFLNETSREYKPI